MALVGQVLSIAVEGILKECLVECARPSDTFSSCLEQAKGAVRADQMVG